MHVCLHEGVSCVCVPGLGLLYVCARACVCVREKGEHVKECAARRGLYECVCVGGVPGNVGMDAGKEQWLLHLSGRGSRLK